MAMRRIFITGGAGFIGSNLVGQLMTGSDVAITVYDNFSVGRREHLAKWLGNPNLTVINGDLADGKRVCEALSGHDAVFHFAANSDIARAANEPRVDFANGTALTEALLEAMRMTGVSRITFASGSGVYGDVPPIPLAEDYSPQIPVSTYGASKLASEALISAYCHMFDFTGVVVRFANVVGANMTHGVTHDFIARLAADPTRLVVYGDGEQTKPYIHTSDVIRAMLVADEAAVSAYSCYNVASLDQLKVKEIAGIVIEAMELEGVRLEFTGGRRGWRADVPVYSLDSSKIRRLGWVNKMSSAEAVRAAVESRLSEIGFRRTRSMKARLAT
jgi:UDP-glucose 4-epimerase